jgi:hypothetical protein
MRTVRARRGVQRHIAVIHQLHDEPRRAPRSHHVRLRPHPQPWPRHHIQVDVKAFGWTHRALRNDLRPQPMPSRGKRRRHHQGDPDRPCSIRRQRQPLPRHRHPLTGNPDDVHTYHIGHVGGVDHVEAHRRASARLHLNTPRIGDDPDYRRSVPTDTSAHQNTDDPPDTRWARRPTRYETPRSQTARARYPRARRR